MAIASWMSWEGGVDLVALAGEAAQPNVIVHVARMVHTPIGSAPAGMILIPDDAGSPQLMGFVSTSLEVAKYFGPNIFAGTPFESAPALNASFDFHIEAGNHASVRIEVEGHVVELQLSGLGEISAADRAPGNMPFHDHSLESPASDAKVLYDGSELSLVVPTQGMSGGPAAVYSPCGIYCR